MKLLETLMRGEVIRIRAVDLTDATEATVILASENGLSLAVEPEGGVLRTGMGGGMFVGVVPLSVDPETRIVTDLLGREYVVEVVRRLQ